MLFVYFVKEEFEMISLGMIYDAKKVLEPMIRKTPLNSASKIADNLYIKAENLQKTGAFKLRGAYYKISKLTPEERSHGVIACSAGNHAQGVALAATKNNIKSTICIPAGAPLSKIEATKKYGGEVVLVEGVYDDAYAKAVELMEEKNLTFIHPFNDECVIAGQGTIGLEIIEQLPEVDAVVVPIGGGGLISGIALAVKTLKPECKVIGVQAEGAPSMYTSRKNHAVTGLDSVSTIADGIAVKKPGDLTFELCEQYVDEIVTVSEEEIATAILTLMEKEKMVAEGAGAVSVAAAMFGRIDPALKYVVCVVSGGNIDVNILSRVISKGLVKTGRITHISTVIQDKPGQLIVLLKLLSELGVNILSVNHSREKNTAEVGTCVVEVEMETRNTEHQKEIYHTLSEHGYKLL